MLKWYHIKAGMAWTIGALVALIGLLGAAVAATAQITLTRAEADAIYETKEHSIVMYENLDRQHDETLRLILERLNALQPQQQREGSRGR